MKRWLAPAVLALLSGACAGSRMGEAEVRLEQGQPCFGVTAAELRDAGELRLQAIVLSDLSVQPVARVWVLSADDVATLMALTAGRCVRLDERPAGYSAAATTALQPGHAYEVFINATPAGGRRSTQGYNARFCVHAGAGAAPRLQALAPAANRCAPP